MKATRRTEITAKGKAAVALQRTVGWTRSEWIDEVESALAGAFVLFARAALARKNGRQREARALSAEFERTVFARAVEVYVHPVKRAFDRGVAFETAVAEVASTIPELRDRVEREFATPCPVRRRIDDRDVDAFWGRARDRTRVLRSGSAGMLEDHAGKLGPIPRGTYRVVVIESDGRITAMDLSTLERAKSFANDAASEAESDTPPVAEVFDDAFKLVHEGCPYWLGTWG